MAAVRGQRPPQRRRPARRPGSMLRLCRDLLALRRAEFGGRIASYEQLPAPPGVWAYRRGPLLVAANFTDEGVTLRGLAEILLATSPAVRDGQRGCGSGPGKGSSHERPDGSLASRNSGSSRGLIALYRLLEQRPADGVVDDATAAELADGRTLARGSTRQLRDRFGPHVIPCARRAPYSRLARQPGPRQEAGVAEPMSLVGDHLGFAADDKAPDVHGTGSRRIAPPARSVAGLGDSAGLVPANDN